MTYDNQSQYIHDLYEEHSYPDTLKVRVFEYIISVLFEYIGTEVSSLDDISGRIMERANADGVIEYDTRATLYKIHSYCDEYGAVYGQLLENGLLEYNIFERPDLFDVDAYDIISRSLISEMDEDMIEYSNTEIDIVLIDRIYNDIIESGTLDYEFDA